MNNQNASKLILFLDPIGRNILGELVDSKPETNLFVKIYLVGPPVYFYGSLLPYRRHKIVVGDGVEPPAHRVQTDALPM